MKRFGTTLTATAVSTALFLGVAPATAQEAPESPAPAESPAPEAPAESPAPDAPAETPASEAPAESESPAPEAPAESETQVESESSTPTSEVETEKDGSSVGSSKDAETYTTCEGNVATKQEDGTWLHKGTDGQELTYSAEEFEAMRADDEALRESGDADCVTPGPDMGAILPALIAIPVAGTIIYWYLNKDGKTYVKDKNRVNAEPTAEEKAASKTMLENNADEVAKQAAEANGTDAAGVPAGTDAGLVGGDAADANAAGDRGMLAQTGSNSVARGLAALAVAAMVGALAFVARRRFFA